jgi:2-polyprenyl-3-methyl-5-hydroxy-6-metoxy-1,4-benzoquinol methylase
VLDFGCGPGPALATMFKEAGFDVSIYDAFFAPDTSVLKLAYFDAITTTEVVEHLHHPAEIFDNLVSYLAPHGVLGIMTKTVIDAERFANWHYKNDQTHVCFYSAATFDYLAEKYSMRWEAVANDAFIFSRLTDDV